MNRFKKIELNIYNLYSSVIIYMCRPLAYMKRIKNTAQIMTEKWLDTIDLLNARWEIRDQAITILAIVI